MYKNILVTSINTGIKKENLYFEALKTQIDTLHKLSYDSYEMQYVYDLGITNEQREYLNSISKVKVIDFPENHKHFYDEFLSPYYYGFKISAINDARKFGENILWLDAGICLLKNIDIMFDIIEKEHVFLVECYDPNSRWITEKCKISMDATEKELNGRQLSAGILGYKNKGKYQFYIDEAFNYAKIKDCLVGDVSNHRHDQTIYSILKERYSIPTKSFEIYGEYRGIMNDDQILYVHRGDYKTDWGNIKFK